MRYAPVAWVVLAAGCSSPLPAVPPLPAAADVERMTASLNATSVGGPDVSEFELPPEIVPVLIEALSPPVPIRAEVLRYSEECGRLQVVCRDGRMLDVRLFGWDKSPALFTINGVPGTRGGQYRDLAPGYDKYLAESAALESLLRSIRAGNAEEIRHCRDLLDVSAGRKPAPTRPGRSRP